MYLMLYFHPAKQMKVTLPCFSLLVVHEENSWTVFHILQYVSTAAVYSTLEFMLTEEILTISLPLVPQQSINAPLG